MQLYRCKLNFAYAHTSKSIWIYTEQARLWKLLKNVRKIKRGMYPEKYMHLAKYLSGALKSTVFT